MVPLSIEYWVLRLWEKGRFRERRGGWQPKHKTRSVAVVGDQSPSSGAIRGIKIAFTYQHGIG